MHVRAFTRHPAAASFPAAVEVVEGDFTIPDSLDEGLPDVSAVFLVWTLPFATAPAVVERIARHARRVVFLSAPHRTPHPFFQQPNPMAKLHADIERLLADAGMASTVIRPGMFASNALHWWAPAIRGGQAIRWPYGAAETAPVDDRDVAAVAARVLSDDGNAGGDYVLTGPESLSQAEQVRIIGTAIRARYRVRGALTRRVPARDGGQLAPPRRVHAASGLGRDDGAAGLRNLFGSRRPRHACTHVSPVGH